MLFSFYNLDNVGTAGRRSELLSAHRAYLSRFAANMAFAGPLLAEDHETIAGSLLVLEFPSLKAAQDFIEAEPYTRAGIYASVQIREFRNRWEQRVGFPPSTVTVLDGFFGGGNPAA
jgi:uncharacterized protein YciI